MEIKEKISCIFWHHKISRVKINYSYCSWKSSWKL